MKNLLFKKFEVSIFKNVYFSKLKINNYYKSDLKQNNKRTRNDDKIDFYNMLMFILICIFHPENGYASILNKMKLCLITKCKSFKKISDSITPSGICKARKRFSSSIFEKIWKQIIIPKFYIQNSVKLWHDFTVCAVDGTTFTLNKSEEILKKFPIINKALCPKMIVCILYDIYSKIPLDIETGNINRGERNMLSSIIDRMKKNILLLLDRGYPAYWLFHKLIILKKQFVIRVPYNFKYKIVKKNSPNDLIIKIQINNSNRIISKNNLPLSEFELLPDFIQLRLIKTTINGFRTRYIVTSLLDEIYSYEEICKLYCSRWMIENYYRDLKHILKIDKFHAEYVDGIYQEIYGAMILTVILQKYISKSSFLYNIPYEEISIKKTYFILIEVIFSIEIAKASFNLIFKLFINLIAKSYQKKRPGRSFERIFFRKQKCYDYKSR